MTKRGGGHPWGDFLEARARALVWLREVLGESPEKICQTMAMDPGQVRLILDSWHPCASCRGFGREHDSSPCDVCHLAGGWFE